MRITNIGHASILIEMDGVRLLTDPVLRRRVFHLKRQSAILDIELLQNLDAVLISHAHWDHLDIPTLKLLDRNVRIIIPEGLAALLRRAGFSKTEELPVNQITKVGCLTVKATCSNHSGARPLIGPQAESIGYIITGSHQIYFAGDTALFPGMADFSNYLDVALLPVWGWGPNLGPGHMNPFQAAQALRMLKPNLAIPIHWGTYYPWGLRRLFPNPLQDPPMAFENFAGMFAPEVKIKILNPGERFAYDC